MKITKELVIKTASDIADQSGLNAVSLKAVALTLSIKAPSLYNHIESLDSLLRSVAHAGMREMNRLMAEAAVGKSGTDALDAVSIAYLDFMIEHPGVYETIQWGTWHGTAETSEIYSGYTSLLKKILTPFQFTVREDEAVQILAGMLHGYTTIQLKNAFTNAASVRKNLCTAVQALINGLLR